MAIVLAQPLQVDVEAKGWESEGVFRIALIFTSLFIASTSISYFIDSLIISQGTTIKDPHFLNYSIYIPSSNYMGFALVNASGKIITEKISFRDINSGKSLSLNMKIDSDTIIMPYIDENQVYSCDVSVKYFTENIPINASKVFYAYKKGDELVSLMVSPFSIQGKYNLNNYYLPLKGGGGFCIGQTYMIIPASQEI